MGGVWVIDLMFVAEWAWFTLLVSARGAQMAFMCSGGAVAATYVGARLSGWMATVFTPPTSPVFQWISAHVSTRPDTVAALSAFVPAQAVIAGGASLNHWVAYHLLYVLFYTAITGAVFVLFLMVWQFSNAVWDHEPNDLTDTRTWASVSLATVCGAYLVMLTGIMIGNVAWLRDVPFLADAAQGSVGMHWVGSVVHAFGVLR